MPGCIDMYHFHYDHSLENARTREQAFPPRVPLLFPNI
jgi:hypothetical protein